MFEFLSQNAGTILIGAVLLIVVVCIVLKMRKNKKNGGSSCGCGCGGCANESFCHGGKES